MPLSCGFAHISFRFVPFYLCGLANFNTVCYPVDLYTSSCDCPVDDIRVRTSVNVLESREIKMRMTAAE